MLRHRTCGSSLGPCSQTGWVKPERFCKSFWCSVTPGGHHGFAYNVNLRQRQMDACIATLTPSAFHRLKNSRIDPNEFSLLIRCHFDDCRIFVGISERCKNLPAHAEIRMMHVRRFDSFGEIQRELAKIVRRHVNQLADLKPLRKRIPCQPRAQNNLSCRSLIAF
jgi:hypothetical protein